MNNEELVNTDSSPISEDRTTASAIELEKELEEILIEDHTGYLIEDLKQFILQRESKVREEAIDTTLVRFSKELSQDFEWDGCKSRYEVIKSDVLQLLEGK